MTALTDTFPELSPHARMILRQMQRDKQPVIIRWDGPWWSGSFGAEADAHAVQELLAAGLIRKVQAFVTEEF